MKAQTQAHGIICSERLRALGYRAFRMDARTGPFAAVIFDIVAEHRGKPPERLIYKVPSEGRTGELKLIAALSEELSPWLPDVVCTFEEDPQAILMKYAGEPFLRTVPLHPPEAHERMEALYPVAEKLAKLHLATVGCIDRWAGEGKVESYAFSREWADWALSLSLALEQSGHAVFGGRELEELQSIADRFYQHFSIKTIKSPYTMTHGDPHWENILILDGRITLIDWEWCRAATPMRDIAILLQDEPDDEIVSFIAQSYADRLLGFGYPGDRAGLLEDFDRMMVDNAFMMLGWKLELLRRGDGKELEMRQVARRMSDRIFQFWNRVEC